MLISIFSICYYIRYRRLPLKEIQIMYKASAKAILVLLFLLLISSIASAAGKWDLKKDSEGIKIYTADVANSNVKALRAEFITTGTPAKLSAILLDINGQPDWVYSTRSSKLVKRISDRELIYYSEKSMPWPVTNRDAVMSLRIEQNILTKVMTVRATTVSNAVAVKKNIIRVPASTVTWVVTPIDNNRMKVVYEATLDPGGSIPAWIVNMFTTKGPFETFKKLKSILANRT